MNREQLRRAERKGLIDPSEEGGQMTLAEWLNDPEKIARRGEVWGVIQTALALHERRRVHNRWYNRLFRRIRLFFHKHLPGLTGPLPEGDQEEFPEPEPGMDEEPPDDAE